MRKRLLIGAGLALSIILLLTTIAHAVTWTFSFPVTVTDTSNVTRAYYPVILNSTGQQYINAGYINTDGLNTNMQIGTTSIQYMVANDHLTTVVPQLPAGGKAITTFYTGYSPQQASFPIITGDGGYVTTNDTAALELSNNGTISYKAYIDTTAGSEKNLFKKDNAIYGYVDNVTSGKLNVAISGNITANTAAGAGWNTPLNAVDNSTATSANYTIPISSTSGYLTFTYNTALNRVTRMLYYYDRESISVNVMTVDLFSNGAWINVFNADPGVSTLAWNTVTFASMDNITQSRVSFTNANLGSTRWVQLYEMPLFGIGDPYIASISGVSSADTLITTYLNGTNFWVTAGSQSSSNLSAITVENNSNPIIFGQNNSSPYIDYIKWSVNGVEKLWYQPNTMITHSQIPDREGTKDGDITWGTNHSIALHAGVMVSSNSTSAMGGNISVGFTMPTVSLPNNWFGGGSTSTLPFFDTFSAVSSSSGVSTQMIYFIIAIAFAFLAMLLVMRFTRSNLLGIIVFNSILFMGTSNNVVPMWVAFSSTLVQFGILYLSRQV